MIGVRPSYAILWSILKMLCVHSRVLLGAEVVQLGRSSVGECGWDAVDTVGEGGLKPIPSSLTPAMFLRHDAQVHMK